MKRYYVTRGETAGLESKITCRRLTDEEWEIQRIDTLPIARGRGHASALLKEVCIDADREGIVLLLTSGLGLTGGLDASQLQEWYARHGFDAIAPGGFPGTVTMQRPPNPMVLR